MMNVTDYTSGFLLGLSLILAIGSQNAFVLKQGIKREHIFFICLFCAVSDAPLISAGVAGFGAVTARYPHAVDIANSQVRCFCWFTGYKVCTPVFDTLNRPEIVGDSTF